MPHLNEQTILQIAEKAIADRKLTYDHEEGLKARYDGPEKLREGQVIPIWTVSYITAKNPFFDQNTHYILINDNNAEVLYIVTPTTYIE